MFFVGRFIDDGGSFGVGFRDTVAVFVFFVGRFIDDSGSFGVGFIDDGGSVGVGFRDTVAVFEAAFVYFGGGEDESEAFAFCAFTFIVVL